MKKTLKIAARAGDPKAIEQLIAKALQAKRITVQVARADTKLIILLSAEATPDSRLINIIKKGLDKIRPQGIRTVTVRARNVFSTRIAWTKQWYLAPPSTQHQSITSTTSGDSVSSAPLSVEPGSSNSSASHASTIGQTTPLSKNAATPTSDNIWRSKNLLVMRRDAQLPDRCIKTNQPAHGKRYQAKLNWQPPWIFLFIFAGIIPLLFAAHIWGERATVYLGMTEGQLKKQKQQVLWGWITFIAGILFCILPLMLPIDDYPGWLGWFLALGSIFLFAGPLISLIYARPVGASRITDDFIWLRGISKSYLDNLPEWKSELQNPKRARSSTTISMTANRPKPWHRLHARCFDTVVAIVLMAFVLEIISPAAATFLMEHEQGDIPFLLAMIFSSILIESILLSSWGTTPGKALMKIKVRQKNGKKLTFLQALERSFLVWVQGCSLSFVTMLYSHQQLTNKGATAWDRRGKFTVSHGCSSWLRQTIIPFLVFIFIALGIIVSIEEEFGIAIFPPGQELILDGDHFLSEDRYQDALDAYDQAIELGVNDAITWHNRGLALHELEQYEAALLSYDKSVSIDANNALVWNDRGNVLSDLARYEEAVIAYDRAIDLEPDAALIWANRGMALGFLGRNQDALTSLKTALKQDTNDAYIWFVHSHLLYQMGDHQEARNSYNKAIKIDPDMISDIMFSETGEYGS